MTAFPVRPLRADGAVHGDTNSGDAANHAECDQDHVARGQALISVSERTAVRGVRGARGVPRSGGVHMRLVFLDARCPELMFLRYPFSLFAE